MKSLPADQSPIQRYEEMYLRINALLQQDHLSFDECGEIRDYFNEELFQEELHASCRILNIDSTKMLDENEECRVRPRAEEFLRQFAFSQDFSLGLWRV